METTFEQIRGADGDPAALTVRFELTLECLKWREAGQSSRKRVRLEAPKGDGVAQAVDRRNAVFPLHP
jgi:hypothetical protein